MSDFKFDFDYIRQLAGLIDETGLNEIEVREGESSIRIKKPEERDQVAVMAPTSQPVTSQQEQSEPLQAKVHHETINAPMVGTFYKASSPDAEPFVKAGDKVKKGQVICVIEAMKTFNQIEADRDGEVVDILAEDAQPVEFNQPLFAIK